MFDHISFAVTDFVRSREFYTRALAPLGYKMLKNVDLTDETGEGGYAGFGAESPRFWIGTGTSITGSLHLAFVARDRDMVRAFYEAAMACGGQDNGPPGLRPHYHPNYYGAFVLDPNGHNIEVVCHDAG